MINYNNTTSEEIAEEIKKRSPKSNWCSMLFIKKELGTFLTKGEKRKWFWTAQFDTFSKPDLFQIYFFLTQKDFD